MLEALNYDEAICLLSLNAFRNDCTHLEVRELAKQVTLCRRNSIGPQKFWVPSCTVKVKKNGKANCKSLKKLPCSKIHNVLKLSWESWSWRAKNFFLDIACFFYGYYVQVVKYLLDACGYSTTIGLRSLKDKALLNIEAVLIQQ